MTYVTADIAQGTRRVTVGGELAAHNRHELLLLLLLVWLTPGPALHSSGEAWRCVQALSLPPAIPA
jgi:hypothetical protein